jgi:hypothetical protein
MGCFCSHFNKLTLTFCIVLWGEQFFLDDNHITLCMLVMFVGCYIRTISLIKTLVFLGVT